MKIANSFMGESMTFFQETDCSQSCTQDTRMSQGISWCFEKVPRFTVGRHTPVWLTSSLRGCDTSNSHSCYFESSFDSSSLSHLLTHQPTISTSATLLRDVASWPWTLPKQDLSMENVHPGRITGILERGVENRNSRLRLLAQSLKRMTRLLRPPGLVGILILSCIAMSHLPTVYRRVEVYKNT